MPTSASASPKVTVAPTGTSSPRARRTRANATTMRSGSGMPGRGRLHDLRKTVIAPPLLVLAVLEDGPEGQVDGRLVEHVAAERGEGLCPVDRLGHARRLVQVQVAQHRERRSDLC